MAAIFLSYAREDQPSAERLARVLEQADHEVWWDRRIGTGRDFSAEIEAAIDKADIVLVAWSTNAAKSPWVRDEATIGRDTGRLLPVLIDKSEPPIGFRQFQALDLAGWKALGKDSRTKKLINAVDARLTGKAAQLPHREPRPRSLRPRTVAAGLATLVLIIVGGTAAYFLSNGDNPTGASSKPAIALLPFTTSSSDAELRQLGSQARDAVTHTFSRSGVPLRLLDSAPQDARSGVDFLISGDVSRNADKVIATIRLEDATHRVTVYSHQFEATGAETRNLPERIGAQLAGSLTWRAPMMMLDRRRPIDPALLSDLLQTMDFTGDQLQAYQNVNRAALKAPDLAIAQIGAAFSTGFMLDQIPRQERAEAVATARRAAERALVLAPDFGDTFGTWCILHSETRLTECEDRLRAGRRIDPDAPFLSSFLSQMLQSVGRFDESMHLTGLSYTHDLYVPTKIGWMLKLLEYSGEHDRAHELYQQGVRWWPEFKGRFFRNRFEGLVDRGDFDTLERLEQSLGAANLPPGYPGGSSLTAALKQKSVSAARRACTRTDDDWLNIRCMLVLSSLGDQDGAYAIADKLYPRRVGRTPAETERIWLDGPGGVAPSEFITSPAAAPLRRDQRFLQLARRVGLLAYWRSGRPPEFCGKNSEPICSHLLTKG